MLNLIMASNFNFLNGIGMNKPRFFLLASIIVFAVLILLLTWNPSENSSSSVESPILLYCAAGIKPPVAEVAKNYETEYGYKVDIQYGGSGTLLNNLKVASTGDLYIAADESYIEIARQQNLVEETIPLAVMTPVIAVPKGNPKGIHSIQNLTDDNLKIALGNPDAASIGKVSKKLLIKSGDWPAIKEQVTVFYPTVPEIANSIKLGAIDAGIVWDTTVNQYPELDLVRVPELELGPQKTTIGVLKTARNPATALRFARYLAARDRGLIQFNNYGYIPVSGDVWMEKPEILFFSGGVNRLAIEQTIQQFEKREGIEITRVYNGCGILVAQIRTGAKPDAYFACDVSFMTQVQSQFDNSTNISETDIVILTKKNNPKQILNLSDLAQAELRLGVANADQSALGDLTRKMLQSEGVYDNIMKNVRVETPTADLLVNQLLVGPLDAVIVYEANCANVLDDLELIRLNLSSAKAVQPIAIGRKSDHKYLISRLLEAIKSPQSKTTFESIGFRWIRNKNEEI
ncbi:TPA: molybdate ABC transporter substrate-binding protein [Candidatus Poribacteria bacterium]|nr:molybdate ABC transporter substrate-binding protein [Candidatus Poribacteria bacterium]